MYTGYLAAVEGKTLVLASPALPGASAGWAVNVLDGDGAGQYGRVVSVSADKLRLTMDRHFKGLSLWTTAPAPVPQHAPWNGSVIPQGRRQSLVHLQPFRGRTLFFRNFIADTGVLQMYGQAFEVIIAEHYHERTDGIVSYGVTESAHNPFVNCSMSTSCSFGANLMLQFLDITFAESNHMWIWADASTTSCYNEYSFLAVQANRLGAWWDGSLARNLIYRRNRVVGYGGFAINGLAVDALLESNEVLNFTKSIFVNETSTSNVVLHNNSLKTDDLVPLQKSGSTPVGAMHGSLAHRTSG